MRVRAAGVCGSELEAYTGASTRRKPPLILGHELAGVVEGYATPHDAAARDPADGGDAGSAREADHTEARDPGVEAPGPPVGTPVVVDPLIPCGTCPACLAGRTYVCPRRALLSLHRDGGQAELVSVPRANLLWMPDGLTFEAAALAEPLATILHAFEDAGESVAGRRVLVLGAGGLGLLAVQAARALGARSVVTSDLVARRQELARRLGAEMPAAGAIEHGSADFVIDTVGAAATREIAVRAAVPGGTIALVGQRDPRSELDFRAVIANGLRLVGVYAYTRDHLRRALASLHDGSVVTDPFVSTYPLRDGPGVYAALVDRRDEVVKAVLVP